MLIWELDEQPKTSPLPQVRVDKENVSLPGWVAYSPLGTFQFIFYVCYFMWSPQQAVLQPQTAPLQSVSAGFWRPWTGPRGMSWTGDTNPVQAVCSQPQPTSPSSLEASYRFPTDLDSWQGPSSFSSCSTRSGFGHVFPVVNFRSENPSLADVLSPGRSHSINICGPS